MAEAAQLGAVRVQELARRLGLPFWVVLGEGGYDRPITAPVGEVVALVSALLKRRAASYGTA